MAREGSETAAQREGSLWQDKPVAKRQCTHPSGQGQPPHEPTDLASWPLIDRPRSVEKPRRRVSRHTEGPTGASTNPHLRQRVSWVAS